MRFFALLSALLAAGACTSTGAVANAPVTFRVVTNSGYASASEPGEVAVFDAETYRQTWDDMVGGGNPPAIDFSTESAVFLFGGLRPTGGYTYEVRGATVEGETLVVEGGVKSPASRAPAATVQTSPYTLIAVKSRAFKYVRVQP